jgi:selenocysteine lyase/cysteine desulfurase
LIACKIRLAKFLHCNPDELFFFPQGSTAAINYVAMTMKIDNILISEVEHHANYLPWLANIKNVEILSLDTSSMSISLPTSKQLSNASLISISAKSNVIGNIWTNNYSDLKKIIELAHQNKCLVMIDAAQAILDPFFNLKTVPADIVVFSAHKIYGPTNLGVMFISKKIHTTINLPDQTVETLPLISIANFNESLKFIKNKKVFGNLKQEKDLAQELINFLNTFEFVKIFSNQPGSIISFSIEKIHPHDLADLLRQQSIVVSSGNHCAKPLHDKLGIFSSVRISLGCYNDLSDVLKFKKGFIAACRFLGIM